MNQLRAHTQNLKGLPRKDTKEIHLKSQQIPLADQFMHNYLLLTRHTFIFRGHRIILISENKQIKFKFLDKRKIQSLSQFSCGTNDDRAFIVVFFSLKKTRSLITSLDSETV